MKNNETSYSYDPQSLGRWFKPAGDTKFYLLNQHIEATFQGSFLFILQIPLPCFSLPIKI